jgi:transmembrane sensor
MESENKHIDPTGLLPEYFAGEATPEERRLVDDWLSADSRNRQEFEAFEKLWNITGKASAKGDINLDVEWQRMESVITPARVKTISMVRILQMAASIVLLSALAFIGLKITGVKSEKAPVAELSTISLPDGSVISLNAGSKISYKKGFGLTHRDISLKGEAYFEVKNNTALPFIIETSEASIKVTGTKFNVKAYKDKSEIRVTVTEGSVELYETGQPAKEATLRAGETGTFDKTMKVIKKQAVLNLNDIAWKTRIMDFSNTPLAEVGDILSNTYHTEVVIDPAVQHCSITVRFENQDLPAVLTVLKSTLDLSITTDGDRIIIRGNGC